jgi:hypothetical protein
LHGPDDSIELIIRPGIADEMALAWRVDVRFVDGLPLAAGERS